MKPTGRLKPCKFVAFDADPEVCDTCGELAESHPKREAAPSYREAMWRAMLLHGGIPDYYSGDYGFVPSLTLRAHFGLATAEEVAEANPRVRPSHRIVLSDRPCQIKWSDTDDPENDTVAEFDGSDCESLEIPAMVGSLTCVCGEYYRERVALLRKTLGQLIWLVVKAGDDIAADGGRG